MFNMATGTGKTLLMASTILYYYQQGYYFLITSINKIKNFFTEKIVIDDKTVNIKKVDVLVMIHKA